MKLNLKDVYEDFSSNKEMFDFSNYLTKSKCYKDSNKLVIRKMKDETGGVAIEEFVVLKPKMYSFLVDNNEHKKAKGINKNVVTTIGHNEYKLLVIRVNYKNTSYLKNYLKNFSVKHISFIFLSV